MSLDAYVLERWPDALGIRRELGPCPNCRRTEFFTSFILPQFVDVHEFEDGLHEDCGFVCAACGWSNAGARPMQESENV